MMLATLKTKPTDDYSYWADHPDIPKGPMIIIEKGLYHQRVKMIYPKLQKQIISFPAPEPCRPGTEMPTTSMTITEMEDIMNEPGQTPLLKWMEDAMRFIEHGEGDTLADRILANAMQGKLKKAGRMEDAAQIAEFFNEPVPKWKNIMEWLELCNPQEFTNEKAINDFAKSFTWKKNPMFAIYKALREMGIMPREAIISDLGGVRLFRKLRERLPREFLIVLHGRERDTWKEVVTDLQQLWNSEQMDAQVVGEMGAQGGQCLTYPVHPKEMEPSTSTIGDKQSQRNIGKRSLLSDGQPRKNPPRKAKEGPRPRRNTRKNFRRGGEKWMMPQRTMVLQPLKELTTVLQPPESVLHDIMASSVERNAGFVESFKRQECSILFEKVGAKKYSVKAGKSTGLITGNNLIRSLVELVNSDIFTKGNQIDFFSNEKREFSVKPHPTEDQPGNALISPYGIYDEYEETSVDGFRDYFRKFCKEEIGKSSCNGKNIDKWRLSVLFAFEIARRMSGNRDIFHDVPAAQSIALWLELDKETFEKIFNVFGGEFDDRLEASRYLLEKYRARFPEEPISFVDEKVHELMELFMQPTQQDQLTENFQDLSI